MIDQLLALAQSNQMLAAGIGTVAFGSLMYLVKSVPLKIFHTLKRLTTIELELNSDSTLYHELVDLLGAHRVALLARLFTTNSRSELTAGYGASVAFWRGRFVVFNRTLIENKLRLDEKVHITIFSRRLAVLAELITAAKRPPPADLVKIYQSGSGYFYGAIKKRKRSLDTVFCAGTTVADIKERIQWFLDNEDWYARRGIPYKLVIFLHGPPGTGKTSLVFAMASEFGRNLASIGNINDVERTFATTPANCFVVVEDIDILTVSRTDDGEKAQAPAPAPAAAPAVTFTRQSPVALSALHAIINTVDGLATPHGLIMFITTNFKQRLDPALIRDGRIDMECKIGPLDHKAAAKMFEAFYDRGVSFAPSMPPLTGAELQAILLEESDPANAVDRIWRKKPEAAESAMPAWRAPLYEDGKTPDAAAVRAALRENLHLVPDVR